jgi:hypothetical protein
MPTHDIILKKIISGGQTGGDMGGLLAAEDLGFETGGYATKGSRTEDGPNPELVSRFGLTELESASYMPRTEANAEHSDGTLIMADVADSAGTAFTIRMCDRHDRPHILNPTEEHFLAFLINNRIETLNVAGNRESVAEGMEQRVRDFLNRTLKPFAP